MRLGRALSLPVSVFRASVGGCRGVRPDVAHDDGQETVPRRAGGGGGGGGGDHGGGLMRANGLGHSSASLMKLRQLGPYSLKQAGVISERISQ